MIRLRRISSLTVVLFLMASSLILVTAGAAHAAGYDPNDALITLDDANPSLHYEGPVTIPDAWVWGNTEDIGTWVDVWQLTVATSASCDAIVRIEWFDDFATQDVFELWVDDDSQGVNPADGATVPDRTGSTDVVLADGPHEIIVDWLYYRTDQPQISGGSHYDITFDIVGCDNYGVITSPDDGDILLTGDTLVLGFDYYDDDYDHARWAVRHNASSSCGGGTVVGNVDGHSDAYTWDGATFAASFDTTGWATGDYCFVVNPANESTENQVREVQWFRIADGHINGGGQIIEEVADAKPFKVSFGGALWQFGSTVECDWTVEFHNVSLDDFDKATFLGSSCTAPQRYSDVGADGITNFMVFGELNGVSGYKVIMRLEDYTEPGAQDTIRFELWDGSVRVYDTSDAAGPGGDFDSVSTLHGTARTELDRGNLQMDLR